MHRLRLLFGVLLVVMMAAIGAPSLVSHPVSAQSVPIVWSWHGSFTEHPRQPVVVEDGLALLRFDGDMFAANALNGNEIWSLEGREVYSFLHSPVLADGMVIVAAVDSSEAFSIVLALDASNGGEIWRSEPIVMEVPEDPQVSVSDGIVVYRDSGRSVRAVDASTGEALWSSGDESVSSMAVSGDRVFVHSLSSIRALELRSGEEDWRFDGEGHLLPDLKVFDDVVVLRDAMASVYALDQRNGDVRWSVKDRRFEGQYSANEDGVFVYELREDGDYLVSLDVDDGDEHWSTSVPDHVNISIAPSTGEGIVAVVGETGATKALSIENGEIIWSNQGSDQGRLMQPVIAYGIVWVVDANLGDLYGLSRLTGQPVAGIHISNASPTTSQPVIDGSLLYIRSEEKQFAFDITGVAPSGIRSDVLVNALMNTPIDVEGFGSGLLGSSARVQYTFLSGAFFPLNGIEPLQQLQLTFEGWNDEYQPQIVVFSDENRAAEYAEAWFPEVLSRFDPKNFVGAMDVDTESLPKGVRLYRLEFVDEIMYVGTFQLDAMMVVTGNTDTSGANEILKETLLKDMMGVAAVLMEQARDAADAAVEDVDDYPTPPALVMPTQTATGGTATNTPLPSATSLPSFTPAPTETPIPTATPEPTFTPTTTQTPSPTLTATITMTATVTSTPTITLTPTPTFTVTPSVTPSITNTPTPTLTPTFDSGSLSFDTPPDWAGQGGNPYGNGEVEILGIATAPSLAWSADLCEDRCQMVLIAGDTLIVSDASRGNVLDAYDLATGELIWTIGDPGSYGYFKDPVVANGRLFVNWHFDLVAVDLETGELLWTTPMKGSNEYGSLNVIGDLVVYSNGSQLGAVLADNGQPVWTNSIQVGRPYWTGTSVVAATYGRVYAFDPTTGALQWEQAIDGFEPSWGWMVIDNGPIVMSNQSLMIALDPAEGSIIWTAEASNGSFADGPGYWEGLVIARMSKELVAYDAGSGVEAWRVQLPTNVPSVAVRVVVSEGVALVELQSETSEALQQVAAYNASTGELLWSVAPSRTPRSNTYFFTAAGEWLVVSTADQQIVVYRFTDE